MEDIKIDFTEEQMSVVGERKATEILEMFKAAINSQITDSVTQLSPETVHKIAVACSLAHIVPFEEPLQNIPMDKLNGAALERLQLVVQFWEETKKILQNS